MGCFECCDSFMGTRPRSLIGGLFAVQHNLIPRGNVKGTITVDGEEIDAAGTGFFVNAVQLNPQNIKR